MRVRLDYGRGGLEVELPDECRPLLIRRPDVAPLPDPARAVREACARPIGTPALAELARGRRNAVVVISDRTRPIPYAVVLPPLLEALESGGIAREHIEILVATGLHRPCSAEELVEMTGAEVVARYRIRNHAARSHDEHVHLGRTSQGTEILIDRGYLDPDF